MAIMLPRLIIVEPGSTVPSVTICMNTVKIAPNNEVTEHNVNGAGKLTMVAACIIFECLLLIIILSLFEENK